jgi:hypothetical protein
VVVSQVKANVLGIQKNTSPSPPSSVFSSNTLIGMIVGSVVGFLAVAAGIGLVTWFVLRKKRSGPEGHVAGQEVQLPMPYENQHHSQQPQFCTQLVNLQAVQDHEVPHLNTGEADNPFVQEHVSPLLPTGISEKVLNSKNPFACCAHIQSNCLFFRVFTV